MLTDDFHPASALRLWSTDSEFPKAYNMPEVQARLGQVADEIERLRLENKGLRVNLEGAGVALAYYAAGDDPEVAQTWIDGCETTKNTRCDGDHGGPRCADPECWQDEGPAP